MAVHFLCTYLDESFDGHPPSRLQGDCGSHHISFHEPIRFQNGAVHMRLGGKVDDRLNAMLPGHSVHESLIADIPADKGVARMPLDVSQVLQIAGVAESIEIDHLRVLPSKEEADEVRPNESRPAGDQNTHRHHSHSVRLFTIQRQMSLALSQAF